MISTRIRIQFISNGGSGSPSAPVVTAESLKETADRTMGEITGIFDEFKSDISKQSDTSDAYAIAEQEIETDSKDERLWRKAFVDAGGDEGKQKALYMKYRAEEINS